MNERIKIDYFEAGEAGFRIGWSVKGMGFGEIDFYKKGKKYICDDECLGREFVKKVLDAFLYKCKLYREG